jgi:hypothetical protein
MTKCNIGYKPSTTDSHSRCVKIINNYVCGKEGNEYSTQTRKCRTPCKKNEERIMRKDKGGTICRLRCKSNQERGIRYCRKRCSSTQKRSYRRGPGRRSRCVYK